MWLLLKMEKSISVYEEKLSEVREDLDSKVRLTISLIGVGNAGNQVAGL